MIDMFGQSLLPSDIAQLFALAGNREEGTSFCVSVLFYLVLPIVQIHVGLELICTAVEIMEHPLVNLIVQ